MLLSKLRLKPDSLPLKAAVIMLVALSCAIGLTHLVVFCLLLREGELSAVYLVSGVLFLFFATRLWMIRPWARKSSKVVISL